MKTRTNWLRGVLAGAVAASMVTLPSLGVAQARGAENQNCLVGSSVNVSNVAALLQRRYRADEWRRMHPNWNGHYYYHSGAYYYDPSFTYGAIVDNEWGDIAVGNGGVSISAGDPYVYFSGSYGSWYPTSQVDIDLHGGGAARARAGYFSRPYFYREGVRYDRVVGTHAGVRSYRFVRHPH
jgi:hypothetical protein